MIKNFTISLVALGIAMASMLVPLTLLCLPNATPACEKPNVVLIM